MQQLNIIGTHSGSFHADDALGIAMLKTLFPTAKIVRTRSPALWAMCDALVDVGGAYCPQKNQFDHHQKGFSEQRDNGIPYAGSGLVWKHYGDQCVNALCPNLAPDSYSAVAKEIDSRLIQLADAVDCGVSVAAPAAFCLSGIISSLNATWSDVPNDDERFEQAVTVASIVLHNLIKSVAAELMAAEQVRQATRICEGKILILDKARLPYEAIVCLEMPEVLFVVYPESSGGRYQVRVVPERLGTFTARANLPARWAGLNGADLAHVTGVPDAEFCHTGRFICGASSSEGALHLALLALADLTT